MCIYTNDEKCRIADRDIPCVKIVRKYVLKDGTIQYVSLYNFIPAIRYGIGKTSNMNDSASKPSALKPVNKAIGEQYHSGRFENLKYLVDEGLHSFCPDAKSIRDIAMWALDEIALYYLNHPYSDETRILAKEEGILEIAALSCVIPAGTKYVEGFHNCKDSNEIENEHGYCSESLRVLSEIKTYKIGD